MIYIYRSFGTDAHRPCVRDSIRVYSFSAVIPRRFFFVVSGTDDVQLERLAVAPADRMNRQGASCTSLALRDDKLLPRQSVPDGFAKRFSPPAIAASETNSKRAAARILTQLFGSIDGSVK